MKYSTRPAQLNPKTTRNPVYATFMPLKDNAFELHVDEELHVSRNIVIMLKKVYSGYRKY